ncbi:hypothetical protein STSO111631_20400 [Stackebrandtia soli]
MTTLNFHLDRIAPPIVHPRLGTTSRIPAADRYQEDWRSLAQRILDQARQPRPPAPDTAGQPSTASDEAMPRPIAPVAGAARSTREAMAGSTTPAVEALRPTTSAPSTTSRVAVPRSTTSVAGAASSTREAVARSTAPSESVSRAAGGASVMGGGTRRADRIPWLRRRSDGAPVTIFVDVAPDRRPRADVRDRWITFYVDGRRISGPDVGTSRYRRTPTGQAVGRCPVAPPRKPGPVRWDLTRPIGSSLSVQPRTAKLGRESRERQYATSLGTEPVQAAATGSPPGRTLTTQRPQATSAEFDPPGINPAPDPAAPPDSGREQEPEPSGSSGVERDDDLCLAHIPRRSRLRRIAVWLFGSRAARRNRKLTRCRTCRVEWPCPPLVEQLRHR